MSRELLLEMLFWFLTGFLMAELIRWFIEIVKFLWAIEIFKLLLK